MNARREKKKRWFDVGVRAVALATEGAVEGYVCPLCAKLANFEDLTFEHAPPQALGGREVALTCRSCNSDSGHTLDVEMRRAEDLADWSAGTSKRPIRARLSTKRGELAVNVETERRDGGAFNIVGLPEHNDPNITAAHLAAMDAIVAGPVKDQGFTLTFPTHRYASSTVHAGWLRAALVAAFARLGYRYALRALFAPVRAQIADPAGKHVDRFYLYSQSASPSRRGMLAVDSPRSMRSLAVLMGRHVIFLPGFHADSDTLYERLGERALWPPPRRTLGELRGAPWPWPTKPVLAFDFV